MRYDVAIVGAGPSGAASAIHLARAGYRVAVVDRSAFPRHKACAEYLSPAVEPLLHELGIDDLLDAARPNRLRGFRIFAPDGHVFQGDFAATLGDDGCSLFETGLVIPRYQLDAAIVEGARRAGATVYELWRLASLERRDGLYHLQSAGGQEPIEASLLIAADGIHSTVARRLGLHRTSRMHKVALVAHLRGIADLGEYGEMHVAQRRYVGLAPLEPHGAANRLCNVALVVDERRDRAALAGRAEAFLLESLQTFPGLSARIGEMTVSRHTLAVSRLNVYARHLVGDGVMLVGDAAGYYDPFTGEGIYHALRGAKLATQVALEALAAGDLSAEKLQPYVALQRRAFYGKRLIERIIQSAVQAPLVMNHIAWVLRRRKSMADTIVAVTGDFLPASAVLSPGYLVRLLI